MHPEPSLIATSMLIVSSLTGLLSLPLILRLVKRNNLYGIRIPESFKSEERWFQINRFGGMVMLIWALAVGLTGGIGLKLDKSQWQGYILACVAVVLGGMALVTISILVYAAKTRK